MKSWKIDPRTGDYIMERGSPVEDDSLITPAIIRLKVQRQRWLHAPNSKYGSEFYASHVRVKTTAELEKIGSQALQPLVDDGRAQNVDVQTTAAQRGGIALNIEITNSLGQPEVLTFTPLGVK